MAYLHLNHLTPDKQAGEEYRMGIHIIKDKESISLTWVERTCGNSAEQTQLASNFATRGGIIGKERYRDVIRNST